MSESPEQRSGSARPRYERESKGLEFDRVGFFSDAVFAIAMTLLVVGIGIPTVTDNQLGDALREKRLAFGGTTWALYSWLLIIPLEYLVDRWLKPEDADAYSR